MDLMTRVEFDQDDLDNVMATLSPAEIDGLAFGAIQLDHNGKILAFNQTESDITGRRRDAVLGRNFFNEVAPCCNKPGFRGVFDAGVKQGNLNAMFDYTFDYVMKPTKVKIHMKKAIVGDTYWVFVKRI
ncbi:photoactive yellow protein [Acidisphaera sp. L21]|jgi:photoactive yellow protein|uniref:photoactive yellow protein n=1 Tax=Acidisphaera sp. L21 TaxID=1641851 RepID=UPI001C2090D2|nr:photoactive yellow protein [Acidisphaera sp. L21]